jgi:phenylalanyl-tRNA synthetase beta chain
MPILAMRTVQAAKHPNADRLRVYHFDAEQGAGLIQVVANLQNVYEVGDVVAVALENTVLDDGTVIKKGKYRGERSFGMSMGTTDKPVGADLTADFGATTIEKKVDESTGVVSESVWTKYTSIDGYLKLKDDILAAPEVIVTEKSHGSNFRVGFRGDEYLVGTHTSRVLPSRMDSESWPKGHLIAKALRWCEAVEMKMRVMLWKARHPEANQLGVFGELMGFKCSDLHYGWTDAGVRLFGEVQVDGKFLDYDAACDVISELFPEIALADLLVPVLYRGRPDHDLLRKLRDEPSALAAEKGVEQISEGIVIRSNPETYSEISHDRLIAKWKGPLYCERKSLRRLDPSVLPTYLTAHDLIFDFVTAERIRHVWAKAQASGIPLDMRHVHKVSELLFDDIVKESAGEWPEGEGPETMDRKVLVKWTKAIAADLIAMVMQDLQVGMHE